MSAREDCSNRTELSRTLVLAISLLAAVGCGDAKTSRRATLGWHACASGLECGTLDVPNDYEHSDGSSQHIAVARARASDPSARLGVLLYNLGGPGEESTRVLPGFLGLLSRWAPEVVAHFDIIAFDPRGIGESTPRLAYLEDSTLEKLRGLDPTRNDETERAARDAVADEVLASAGRLDASFASHVDTESVALDLDRLRAALGEDVISFFGGSYGTLLGALYATLFPEHVRAFVLDSPVMPSVDRLEILRAQAQGYEASYTGFLAWCDGTDTCALHPRDLSALPATLDALVAALNTSPLAVADRTLSGSDVLVALGIGLQGGQNDWPALAEDIAQLLSGDGSRLLPLADSYDGRTADGTYADDIVDAYTAISALDAPFPTGFDRAAFDAYVENEVLAVGPTFGRAIAEGERISVGWPFERARPLPSVDARSAPPALLLAGIHDPTTPLPWAYALRDALGNGSSVTTRDDWAHGQFFSNGCIRDRVVAFLVEPAVPLEDASCPFEPAE